VGLSADGIYRSVCAFLGVQAPEPVK